MNTMSRHRLPLIPLGVWLVALSLLGVVGSAQAPESPIEYQVSFPEPEQRWMQVEVVFPHLPAGTFEVRMSRASPGRYAAHAFVKNVFMEQFTDSDDRPLTVARPSPHQWQVEGHDGTVKMSYRIFGDRVDGTYLAIDQTHAHINMPAAFLWASELTDRPIRITFRPPHGLGWHAATQLFPTEDPFTFTAPNLPYFLDSPTELSAFARRELTASVRPGGPDVTIRVAMHHTGTDEELDRFTEDIRKIVDEQRAIFGELPELETGAYTFIADYLPYASGDGMEHRNSTILTSAQSLAQAYAALIGTASHELFHAWNVERIRPASLEPFDFEDVNISSELWLAEGFTNYYGRLTVMRAGIIERGEGMRDWDGAINGALQSPGATFRSAVDMSRMAPLVDRAVAADRTNHENTFYSYYSFGEAIALGLDLTLRARSDSRVTLDDFMRAMWVTHGKPEGPAPGLVARPYTVADARARLAEASEDPDFARDFFARYIEGTEPIDYARLVERAGYVLRKAGPGRATLRLPALEVNGGQLILTGIPSVGSPAYLAGLNRDDVLISIGSQEIASPEDVTRAVQAHAVGDEVRLVYESRAGRVERTVTLVEDPSLRLVPVEEEGGPLSDAQRVFREAWLGSKATDP